MTKNKEKNSNAGLITLMICGVVAVGLIVGCVFFPNAIFGLFNKKSLKTLFFMIKTKKQKNFKKSVDICFDMLYNIIA